MGYRKGTGEQSKAKANVDPLNVNRRLYNQIARLLDDLEDADARDEMTVPQRISALIAVGRVQIMFNTLRKADDNEPDSLGTTVRRYERAFASANASRGTASRPRPTLVSTDDDDDPSGDSGDDPSA